MTDDYRIRSPAVTEDTPLAMPSPDIPNTTQARGFSTTMTRANKTDDEEAGNVFRFSTEKDDERVLKRMGKRTVVLKEMEHVELFERIEAFHRGNTQDNNFLAALRKYGGEPRGDAIVKLVFGAQFYDYILKFKTDEKDDNKKTRRRFEDEMMKAGLFFEYEPTAKGDEQYIKVICPFDVMCQGAEDMNLSFILDEEEDKKGDGVLAKFEDLGNLLFDRSSKCPPRAYFRVEKLNAFKGADVDKLSLAVVQQNFFTTAKRILITNNIISRIRLSGVRKKSKVGIKNLLTKGTFTEYYPLHDGTFKSDAKYTNKRAFLNRVWAKQWFSVQPYEEIREYYGEKIGFYFAWLGYYTYWLTGAAFIGFIAFMYGIGNFRDYQPPFRYVPLSDWNTTGLSSQSIKTINDTNNGTHVRVPRATVGPTGAASIFDHEFTLAYTLIMSLWTTMFLEFWKRRTNILAYRWGMLDFEEEEVTRPEWKPSHARKSPITGKFERYVPSFLYQSKLFASTLVVVLSIIIVVSCVMLTIVFRVWANRAMPNPANLISSAVLSLVAIQVLGIIYRNVVLNLNKWENHRTNTDFENALVSKSFLFNFVNSYSSLFYVGLIKNYAGDAILGNPEWKDLCTESCLYDLFYQLTIVFVGNQIIGQIVEGAFPYFTRQSALKAELKRRQEEDLKNGIQKVRTIEEMEDDDTVPQWVKDDALNKFDDLTGEYNEMALQFGFVTMFVSAFPLGALCALLNNITEIRLDAGKLLREFQRPVPYGAEGIGKWQDILTTISYFAVLCNAALIAFSSEWFEARFLLNLDSNTKLVGRLAFVMLYEHMMFGLKWLFAFIIPDVPEEVRLGMERERYIAKVTIEGAEPAEDDEEAMMMLNGNYQADTAKSAKA